MKSAELAIDVVNGQLERQSRVISGLYQRASILIGASGISTALLTQVGLTLEWLLPIALFVLSIVFAVVSLFFKSASQLEPDIVRDVWASSKPAEFEREVLDGLVGQFESVAETLPSRTKTIKSAMILFASGWVLSFLILLIEALTSIQKAS